LGEYLSLAERGTLVLLDEIAGGTDPDEGAALAASVLGGFVARGAAVATTTHYERLKRLGAGEAAAFVNASVGFDFASMRPTFRVHFGVPGQSSALAVAERYGIPLDLIAHALELLPKQQLHQKRLLEQLETERAQLSELKLAAEAELQEQRALNERLRHDAARAREIEQERLQKESVALTQEVQQARALLRQAKVQLAAVGANAELASLERMVNQAASPVTLEGTLTRALRPADELGALQAETLQPGMRVRIPHLGSIGEIVSGVSKGAVRVNVGGMKLTVPIDRLRALDTAPAMPPKAPSGQSNKHTTASKQTLRNTRSKGTNGLLEPAQASGFIPARTSTNTCDLRGVRVEAGIDNVATFLDQMLRIGEPAAYILHGHGTGAMKAAVREYLGDCRHVTRWEPAAREDGGDALTLCWL
jgi:DNA mismatch repair protein MutS2